VNNRQGCASGADSCGEQQGSLLPCRQDIAAQLFIVMNNIRQYSCVTNNSTSYALAIA